MTNRLHAVTALLAIMLAIAWVAPAATAVRGFDADDVTSPIGGSPGGRVGQPTGTAEGNGATDPDAAPATDRKPIRVLYCTHSAGFRHGVLPHSRAVVTAFGERHDWLTVTVTDEVDAFNEATFAELDVLMLYTSGTLPLDETQKAALVRFLEDGGAIVGIHSATDTFHDWPWYVAAIGGTFDGHPWHEEVFVLIHDADHPATRHLVDEASEDGRPPSFAIHDEIYQFKSLNPRRRTLLSLDTARVTHSVEDDRAYPLAWTLEVEKGRVFYTAFGHEESVWNDERFRQHLLGGIRWAARMDENATSSN